MDDLQAQAIDEALSKYDLPGQGAALRVLLLASAKERDFERFYRHASKLVGDEKMRKTLDAFANDEVLHRVEIQEIYVETKGILKLPDTLEEFLDDCPWQSPVVKAGMPPGDLLDMAIKLEKDAQLYYEQRMGDTSDPEVIELLEYLSVVEEEQYVRLKSLRDELP